MTNKVVQTLARAAVLAGLDAVRFNFRGVGQSAGAWDEGRGERDDMRAVIERLALEPTVRGEFVRRMRALMDDAEDEAARELAARALRRGLAALGGMAP